MFYDNRFNFGIFVQKCRQPGIKVPIIPGLKILTSKRQLTSIPASFHISLPTELTDGRFTSRQRCRMVENPVLTWAFKPGLRNCLEA